MRKLLEKFMQEKKVISIYNDPGDTGNCWTGFVNAVDDGTNLNAWGSINVDDEGTPSNCNVLIPTFLFLQFFILQLRKVGLPLADKNHNICRNQGTFLRQLLHLHLQLKIWRQQGIDKGKSYK